MNSSDYIEIGNRMSTALVAPSGEDPLMLKATKSFSGNVKLAEL
jgi:hypothetical protein